MYVRYCGRWSLRDCLSVVVRSVSVLLNPRLGHIDNVRRAACREPLGASTFGVGYFLLALGVVGRAWFFELAHVVGVENFGR